MNRQNNKTERKKTISDTLFTAFMLFTATAVSFCFFHLGNKNSANITVIYTLALILTALKTSGYVYGIVASLFCVIAVNFLFSYPFFKFNFSLDGYPVTFIGMLAITLITSATTTSLKQHQKAAAEREKALAEADKEKLRANLLRAVSHDLRTPLTSIIGSSSSYLENGSDMTEYERTELVSNIKEDSEWLLNMVENLLTITRIDNNSQDKVKKSPEVVEEVVSEAIQRLRKRLSDVRIKVHMPNDFLMIPMDATLIEQVTEEIDLIITQTKECVSFSVRDYGKGIDPEQLPYIFEGQRSSGKNSDHHKGIGIGLSICKTIIEAHGGKLTAVNHKHGAEFIFTLPKEKEVEANA